MKRIIAWVLALVFFFITVFIPDFSSFADGVVTVDGTFGDLTYDYSDEDYLTRPNYEDYFDVDQDKQYLKYCVNQNQFLNDNDSDFGSNSVNTVLSNINNLNSVVYPDVDGKHSGRFVWWRSTYSTYYYASVFIGDDDLAFVDGYVCSKSPFTIKQYIYSCGSGSINGTYTHYTGQGLGDGVIDDSSNIQYDSTYDIYYRNYGGLDFYEEIPVLLSYQPNNNYTDGSFLDQSPYNYGTWQNVYNAYVNNTDDTGFVIDRRTEKMINGDNSEDELLNDADLMNFQGSLGFEYFDFKGYISKNNNGYVFPNYIINYKLNNYTDLRKNNIIIYADYSFNFKLTFEMVGGMYGYQSADMGTMSFEDFIPIQNHTYGQDLNAYMDDKTFVNFRETSGLHLQSNGIQDYEDISSFNANSMISDFGRYFYQIMNNVSNNHVVNSKRDSYFYITCTFYIEYTNENGRKITSDPIIRKIDYWGDSSSPDGLLSPYVVDQDNSGIIDDNIAYHDFIDSYYHKKIDENTDGYLNYLPTTSSSSGGSVGDITIYQNPYPYVLVDIPENEWMNYTPNLKSLLETYKDALATTKDESILPLIAQTYNYIPDGAMQYLIYGVGIIVMIGIWRAITRR